MIIFLAESSIYLFLDVVFNLLDLVLSGGVRMPSSHRPFKPLFEFEVYLDHRFARQGWGQRSKKSPPISWSAYCDEGQD